MCFIIHHNCILVLMLKLYKNKQHFTNLPDVLTHNVKDDVNCTQDCHTFSLTCSMSKVSQRELIT